MPARDPSVASSPSATSHMSSAALRARRASHGSGPAQPHAGAYPSIPEGEDGGGSTSLWSRHGDADGHRAADESAISFMSADSGDLGLGSRKGDLHVGGVGARR